MKSGFYTALGTPVDPDGRFLPEPFAAQIVDQIAAGASGLLVMGSMGNGPTVARSDYRKVADTAVAAAQGATPLMVGIMDNGIANVRAKIAALGDLPLAGVVATTPFYAACTQEDLISFFSAIAAETPWPLYLYDLPTVTKTAIAADTVLRLTDRFPSVRGIKTNNIFLVRALRRHLSDDRFTFFYSGLDAFDIAWAGGLHHQLDGMFACTAGKTGQMYAALSSGQTERASSCLDDILALRNLFIKVGVLAGFTVAMNLLGFAGRYGPDYSGVCGDTAAASVRSLMEQRGFLPEDARKA